MKHNYSGKSLNELHKEFGEGKGGFFSHWWADQKFGDEKPDAGVYEIALEKQTLENLTFDERVKKLEKGWDVPHPAIVTEAILTHFKKTGEYLMEDWYTRTSALASVGRRVVVGHCAARGVDVVRWCGDYRNGDVGLSASRKFDQSFETGSLESFDPPDLRSLEARVKELESFKEKIEKIIKL